MTKVPLWLRGNRHCFYNAVSVSTSWLPSFSKSHISNWQESGQHYCYCNSFSASFHHLKVCISTSVRVIFILLACNLYPFKYTKKARNSFSLARFWRSLSDIGISALAKVVGFFDFMISKFNSEN